MDGIGDDGFDGEDLDPDAVLWVRGVDYLAGWRDATRAAEELGDALVAAGVDTAGIKLRAAAASDGSGVVRLELSMEAAHEVTVSARAALARWRDAS
ncbi:hypothetical protein OG879_23975 [Streptomyces caniferus]|uniref:Uncharacterized protein n=1 Tax=Streptomyces caniferus TaxID=285557 RepID=A0A640S0N7_9ACTN|nr:hypothetical protein [Streptomyces caniferus]GFE04953.1 hypothetical protein Scani_12210 [Streptomyces caniferus]